uniref:Uncharacterized protein n=1 Tax=Panagrolaimus sp. ES5 TaxID=591445 RepID=A0AC34FM77_9BILA
NLVLKIWLASTKRKENQLLIFNRILNVSFGFYSLY